MYQNVANSVMPPNMAIFQFIVVASTGVAIGKKQKTKKMNKNARAIALIAKPQRPRVKTEGGNGSPRHLFKKMQPMERIYELSNADIVKETIAFSATLEPRLMSEIATPNTKLITTALRGMFQPGLTYFKSVSLYNTE